MPARWNRDKERELIRLVKTGKYTYGEIAEIMGLNRNQIATKANHLGLTNPTYQKRITKHAHLREPVMRFFLTHTWEQTRKRFGLTKSELKSLFTVGYRDPKFRKLRKDRRCKRRWAAKDWRFMAAHAGLMPRTWISKRLGRGGVHAIKDRISSANAGTRYLNGLTHALVAELLPSFDFVSLKTRAGSPGPSGKMHTRIVPWVALEEIIRGKRINPSLREGIHAMARFQRWIHGTKTNRAAITAVKRIIEEEV